MNSIMMTMF